MKPLETYLRELRDIRSSGAGVKETSYYPALSNLLNEVGRTLQPKVRCIINLKNRGAGIPDGGLFTADQFHKASGQDPIPGQIPSRGAIEVKGPDADAWSVADGEQIERYLKRYGQVLVTNYRDFILVGQDAEGQPSKLERYSLASDRQKFWVEAAQPHKLATVHGARLVEYLQRVMLHAAPLVNPEDVAWFLASYAREARARMEAVELPKLTSVRLALEEALGVKFEGAKGEHFFRSTLVQTLFYGIFSAWVLWSKKRSLRQAKMSFDRRLAADELRVPILRKLFHEIAEPGQLEDLNLAEVLDWAGATLNRVDRTAFFAKFEDTHAIQYFYEPFLQAYDPELRKELGVWYTPPEIVRYMVSRVDTVLREELKLEDGLANPSVYVLDPGCGTGTYLVEVLKRIHASLKAKRDDALLGEDLWKAASERVFGFEILAAPFVVAHLQIGVLLQSLGVSLDGKKKDRVGVYLTNALTGWEPPKEPKTKLMFPELEAERDAAERVKREVPILVILGNPPYNAFAGVSPVEEMGLVEPYKEGLSSEWGIKKFNLDDLYVRFFRLAERRIAEKTGRGVVCYISNQSWVSDPSFVVLRKHLLDSFDMFWVENMHGNRKISEYAPDGRTSQTVFAIPGSSVGIQQGVAISLWVKTGRERQDPRVHFRDDLDAAKATERRAQLLASLQAADFDSQYEVARPVPSNRFSFRPSQVAAHYLAWPKLTDLCAEPPSNGLMEKRGGALIDIDKPALEKRMRMYFDPAVDWAELKAMGTGLTEDAARCDAEQTRAKVLAEEKRFDPDRVRRYALRPFETRWCYYSATRPLWNEPRPALWAQCWKGNSFLLSRVSAAKDPEGPPFYYVRELSDDHLLAPDAACFALRLRTQEARKGKAPQRGLLSLKPKANLSPAARNYAAGLGIKDPDADEETAGFIWMHALAIGYSPAYLTENADGIRRDWPRIPLPDSKQTLLYSAELGYRVGALLNTEENVPAVTAGKIRSELKVIATITRTDGKQLNPAAGDLDVRAGWGHAGKGGVTMPARGRLVERPYSTDEEAAFRDGAVALGMTREEAFGRLGSTTCDVYLNDHVFWRNLPAHVWTYSIGGYQVIKKWLSYREFGLLGRALTRDEALEVMNMARRIAAILLLQPALDANYQEIKKSSYEWQPRT